MNRILSCFLMSFAVQGAVIAQDKITVYKSPSCGCCNKWISHLEDNGFKVSAVNMDNVVPKKIEFGITQQTASCHTAVIDGYVVEGHVPAEDIKRLLKTRPKNIKGLAVPGMPIGSPGMEQGGRQDPYAVLSIDKQGRTQVFARHGALSHTK